jgi:hypothetical protein
MRRSSIRTKSARGVTAVEIAIGVSIASLVIVFAVQTIGLFVNANRVASEKTKAIYLTEEGHELLRWLRDGSWNTISALSTNNTYYFVTSTTSIGLTTTLQNNGGYVRSFRLQNVYRNSSDDIVASTTGGAIADTSAKYVTMTTTYGNPTTSVSITTILAEIDP